MFAALYNFDGGPAAPPSTGIDGTLEVKCLGSAQQVALLCTRTPSAFDELSGIETLDGRSWIVGRVRLDGRDDLRARLKSRSMKVEKDVSDAGLCLLAYDAWQDRFVDHLAGDFAFVVWDETRQRLIAARDQFGVRSLFHGKNGARGVVGDSLDWVVAQAAPDRRLDDYWMADFLTLNCSREFERTAYRDVSRLAPGHVLTWRSSGEDIRRYWRLEVAEPLYLDRRETYGELFRDLVARAIVDRAPTRGKVGIAMSGGLDSTTLAACAASTLGDPRRVVAYCEHYEELIDIGEDAYASLAARHLGIDLQVERYDEAAYDPLWQQRGIRPEEPLQTIVSAFPVSVLYRALAARAPVWFEGEGPDNALMFDRDPYLRWLYRRGSWRRLAGTLLDYAAIKGVSGWKETLRRKTSSGGDERDLDPAPPWLSRDLIDRVRLAERIRDLGDGGDPSHPWHPRAVESLTSPIWQAYYSEYDLQEQLGPARWRHPFVDLRVLNFMLSVPTIPWGWQKALIREAMDGRLPDAILQRRKLPLPASPVVEKLRRHGLPQCLTSQRLVPFVDVASLPTVRGSKDELGQSLNAYVVDHWLATMPGPGDSQGLP